MMKTKFIFIPILLLFSISCFIGDLSSNAITNKGSDQVPPVDFFYFNGFNFAVTNGKYLCSENLEGKIGDELGVGWRLADWDKIKSMNSDECKQFISTLRLKNGEGFLIRKGRSRYWGTTDRHYFMEIHNHNKPGSFAAHDNIDDYNISLGSWNNITMRALAYTKAQ